jgi:hypothetical protein
MVESAPACVQIRGLQSHEVRGRASVGGHGDLEADPQALAEIARGLTGALEELRGLGMIGEAGVGRGFSEVALSGLDIGHKGLASAFHEFCDRWGWGVRSLVHDGNEFATRVGLAAGTVFEQDQFAQGVFKDLVNADIGNPTLSNDQVERQSWHDVLHHNAIEDVRHPGADGPSWHDALHNSGQAWQQAGRDVNAGPAGVNEKIADLTGHGDEFRAQQDQLFGRPDTAQQAPSPDGEVGTVGDGR